MNSQKLERSWTDSVILAGEKVAVTVEALLRAGNVRRVVVKQDGRTIAEFPLTLGVVGAAIAPPVAAIAAIVAIVTECTVEIERTEITPNKKEIETTAPDGAPGASSTAEALEPVLSR